MTTARAIIKRAMQVGGILVKGEDPDFDEIQDALNTLNSMVSSWGNDSLIIYARTTETFPLAGAGTYTIGPSGTFNTVRPLDIIYAYTTLGSINYNIGIIDDETFASIAYPSIKGIPEFLNFNNAFPLATIKLYPVDTTSTLTLLTEKALTAFTLDTVLSLPPGWEEPLVYNLSIRLSPEYSQPIDPNVAEIARTSLGAIKIKVVQNRNMDAFPQTLQVRNIFSGWRY